MRPVFVTLGTGGGPVIRKERSEPANALTVGDAVYLFDIGASTQRRMAKPGLAGSVDGRELAAEMDRTTLVFEDDRVRVLP